MQSQLLTWNGAYPGSRRRCPSGRLAEHQDRRKHVGFLENLLGMPEVHDGGHPRGLGKESAQRPAVAGLQPFVGGNDTSSSAAPQNLMGTGKEIHIKVGRAGINLG